MDHLLGSEPFRALEGRYGRPPLVSALRETLEGVRMRLERGEPVAGLDDPASYAAAVEEVLVREEVGSLRQVINATGVILHTNLGRAPLAREAMEAMIRAGRGYSNLEYDLEEGGRGSRYDHCVGLLTRLTGAEDALVVNNNAAALVLALNTLARGREVLVSRGELVEIGGGFRVPEVLERAGAVLREVGSTNRTRLEDYREALEGPGAPGRGAEPPAAILKVHRSNFRISGFTEEASLADLATLGGEHGVPVIHDLGSGLLVDPELLGLPDEPRPAVSVDAGADVVAFSGDKLLGGPQAGILVGRRERIRALRTNPLCRALRVDKATVAALEATLRLHRDPEEAVARIPALRMLATPVEELEGRARRLAEELEERGVRAEVTNAPKGSAVGGGTYPGVSIPTWHLRLEVPSADDLARRLRQGEPPVVGRVEDDGMVLDLRTVAPDEEDELLRRLEEEAG